MQSSLMKWPAVVLVFGLLAGCAPPLTSQSIPAPPGEEAISVQDLDISTGQIVFVPAYSEIYHASGGRTLDLVVTLSVHNTDLAHEIVLTSVRYYATDGQLLQEFLPEPRRLNAMATADFFVDAGKLNGGVGTNFIVEWVAEEAVYEPVVETIMLSTTGSQGISFTSPGRVIKQFEP